MNAGALQQLAAIDARQPWFQPYAEWLDTGRQAVQPGASVFTVLSGLRDRSLADAGPQFVAASGVPPGEAYEAFVARTGSVPARDNLHDFFNGVVWLQFGQAKRRLNQLQSAEIGRAGVGPVRGALRDALTLFDENGALLDAPPALWEALLARDWRRLFVQLRPLWRQARLVVFGHALLEKLVSPRKDLTAHVWRAQPRLEPEISLDSWLAGELTAQRLSGKPFTPLPVLGVPGWWPGNEDFSFYDDALVFRPAGRGERKTTKPSAISRT
ncbi:MAG TPA: DUF3025 domain-containing protein [Ramlibacter sp.]|nr:DUF3025 domain-containing protein [Ramlibacter sp.]